jgi:hypothetical protein
LPLGGEGQFAATNEGNPAKENDMSNYSNIKSTRIRREDANRWGFSMMASIDNPKASKATAYGYLNAILYMAPSDSAGVGDLCPFAGDCKAICLGEHSGQAAMRKDDEDNAVTLARKARARVYMTERELFLRYVQLDVERLQGIARRMGLQLCYRFNGSTDVAVPAWLCNLFPEVTFIDYTKNPNRMAQYLAGRLPVNYHLTFSRDTHNERLAERFLEQGGNVAVVFGTGRPETWHGFAVIDGDKHDVRVPAMDGHGVVVGLTPKGAKAKRETKGFIVREAA